MNDALAVPAMLFADPVPTVGPKLDPLSGGVGEPPNNQVKDPRTSEPNATPGPGVSRLFSPS